MQFLPCPRCLLLLLSALSVHTLTDKEISKFTHKDGSKHVSVTKNGNTLTITSTGWPDHAWQKVNPHVPMQKSYDHQVSNNPSVPSSTSTGSCLPMATIGFALNGVPFYSPYTGESTNAGVCEKFDQCDGHPDPMSSYHYHIKASCVVKGDKGKFVGVAMDGHPIYSAPEGFDKTKLDNCHGEEFMDDGVKRYRYILSDDFPYILGCFKGTVIDPKVKDMMKKKECRFPKDMPDKTTCGGGSIGLLSVQTTMMLLGTLVTFAVVFFY